MTDSKEKFHQDIGNERADYVIIIIVNFINYCFWCVIINHTHARRSAFARKPEITDLSLSLLI